MEIEEHEEEDEAKAAKKLKKPINNVKGEWRDTQYEIWRDEPLMEDIVAEVVENPILPSVCNPRLILLD